MFIFGFIMLVLRMNSYGNLMEIFVEVLVFRLIFVNIGFLWVGVVIVFCIVEMLLGLVNCIFEYFIFIW